VSWAQQAQLVDPFLGSEAGGNVFPGATLPFGMVKAGPDDDANLTSAGWMANDPINRFSQTHVSGTGGDPKYGNIPGATHNWSNTPFRSWFSAR
jgi:putative alpha-1,2-mannosidase